MAVYFVTGKLGSGKSLVAVKRLQEYMQQGRRVATNLDIDIDKILPNSTDNTRHVLRVPDKPTAFDMEMIGLGYEGEEYDESRFGLCVLDELGTWMNSRSWSDKGRKAFLDWTIHARKLRWDIIFIVQNVAMVDAQLRDALCEHLVTCKRSDRVKIMGMRMPKVHVGSVYYGATENKAMKLERWIYRGHDLYGAYDTAQAFSPFYDKGGYCPLIEGYFDAPQKDDESTKNSASTWRRLVNNPIAACVLGLTVGAAAVNAYTDQYSEINTVPLAATEAVGGEVFSEPINWLEGLGVVSYAGRYESLNAVQYMFNSTVAGNLSGGYFYAAGAELIPMNDCSIKVLWSDGQMNIVSCDKTYKRSVAAPQTLDM